MNLLNVINGTETTIELKDLTIFLHTEEIASEYRLDVLSLTNPLEMLRHEYEITEENARWVLISTANHRNDGLFLYNEKDNLLFVNYHLIGDLLLDGVKNKLGVNGFFLFGGIYNNSKVKEIEGIKAVNSCDLSNFMYQKIYGEALQAYNEANMDVLLETAKAEFEKSGSYSQKQVMAMVEEEAIRHFVNDELPTPVRFDLDYEVYFVTKNLTLTNLNEMFEVANQKDEYVSRLLANPVLTQFTLDIKYRRHLTKMCYEENVEKWNQDVNLLAAREIAKLRATGKLRSTGKTAIDFLEFEIILKGKHKKQQAFCDYPSLKSTYFQPTRHAMSGDCIYYQEISKIFVEGNEVFSFDTFKDMFEMKSNLDNVMEEMIEAKITTSKEVKKVNPVEVVLVEARENISQKAKLVKGQMALKLW